MQRSDEQSSADDDLAALEGDVFSDATLGELTDEQASEEGTGQSEVAAGASERAGNDSHGDTTDTDGSAGLRTKLGRVFSPRAFLAALLLSVGGLALGQAVPILGQLPLVGQFLGFFGVFLAGFVFGLGAKHRRYLEGALAGATAAGLAFVANAVLFTFVSDVGLQFAAVGAGIGAVAALLGVYFGRDLRNGLTREIP
jgi:FtsH-binding integral membrane protein